MNVIYTYKWRYYYYYFVCKKLLDNGESFRLNVNKGRLLLLLLLFSSIKLTFS
jgi:hypothetical protein